MRDLPEDLSSGKRPAASGRRPRLAGVNARMEQEGFAQFHRPVPGSREGE